MRGFAVLAPAAGTRYTDRTMAPLWKNAPLSDAALELLGVWKRHLIESLTALIIIGIAAFAALASAAAGSHLVASAASDAYPSNDAFTLSSGHVVTILAGSSLTSLVVDGPSFTVELATDETARFRMNVHERQGHFASGDMAVDGCEYDEGSNYLTLSGPRTVTITPDGRTCDEEDGTAEIVTVTAPDGLEEWQAGTEQLVLWQTKGAIGRMRLTLSTDGGLTYPTTLVSDKLNDGAYVWTVPSLSTTHHARLRIQALGEQDVILAFDVSDVDFTIIGTTPPPEPEEPSVPAGSGFDPAAATAAARSIGADRGLPQASGSAPCIAETRIKGTSSSAVYYCGKDGKRYAFPNQRVHDSWYTDFGGVVALTDAQLAAVPLGGNVTYRPGVRLVKITTDPKTYAVDAHGVLRWVTSEAVAEALYGTAWNTLVDDIPDAFFTNYTIGEPIE